MAPRNKDTADLERYLSIGRLVDRAEQVARIDKEREIQHALLADEIRRALANGMDKATVARLVGVSRQRIGQIVPGKISDLDEAEHEPTEVDAAVAG